MGGIWRVERKQRLRKNSPSECSMEGTSDIWGWEPLWGDQSNGTGDPSSSGEKVEKEGGSWQGLQFQTAKYGIYPLVLLTAASSFTHR